MAFPATTLPKPPSPEETERKISETKAGIERKLGGCNEWEHPIPEHNHSADSKSDDSQLLRNLGLGSNGRMRNVFGEFADRAARAVHEPDLTDEAKGRRLHEITETVLGEIGQVAAGQPGPGMHDHTRSAALHVGQARGQAATLRSRIDGALQVDPTDARAAVRESEVRRHLLGLPEVERTRAINRAVQAADVESLRAITTAPAALGLGSEAEVEEARRALLEAVAPDDLKRAEALEGRVGSVERNAKNLRGRIKQVAVDLGHPLGVRLDLADFG